jgi:hypothetical protein
MRAAGLALCVTVNRQKSNAALYQINQLTDPLQERSDHSRLSGNFYLITMVRPSKPRQPASAKQEGNVGLQLMPFAKCAESCRKLSSSFFNFLLHEFWDTWSHQFDRILLAVLILIVFLRQLSISLMGRSHDLKRRP